jgi:hypothetical protein
VPSATTFALPLMGADRNPMPRLVASARTSAAASAETVEVSTTTLGAGCAFSRPSGPNKRARRGLWTRTMSKRVFSFLPAGIPCCTSPQREGRRVVRESIDSGRMSRWNA